MKIETGHVEIAFMFPEIGKLYKEKKKSPLSFEFSFKDLADFISLRASKFLEKATYFLEVDR